MTSTHYEQQLENHYNKNEISCYTQRWKSALDIFRQAVLIAPDQTAIVAGNNRITYHGLDGLSTRFASALLSNGLKTGDRVAINTSNRLEFVVAIVACLKAQLISVPIPSHHKIAELKTLYKEAGVSAVLFDQTTAAQQPSRKDIKSLKLMISIDAKHDDAIDFNHFILAPVTALPLTVPNESQCVTLLYTSNETEQPKGAMLTNLGIVHSVMHLIEGLSLEANETTIVADALSRADGLVGQMYLMFVCIGKLVLTQKFEPKEFIDLAKREGMSYSVLATSMYDQLLKEKAIDGNKITSWRIAYHSGSTMSASTQKGITKAIPNINLHNGYSAAETTSVAAIASYGSDTPDGTFGKAVPCGEIQIMDTKGKPVETNEVGQLWIKGPMVVPGYWKNAKASKSKFKDGYWKTNDTGYCDKNGYFHLKASK